MRGKSILFEEPETKVPDFHRRISRKAAARALGSRRDSPLAVKRLAVLAAAIAVPAIAAPGDWHLTGDRMTLEQPLVPMGYEIAGESFPGSAFYYLEDVPPVLESFGEDAALPDPADSELAASTNDAGTMLGAGSAALPFRMRGSAQTIARAQQCMTQAIYYEAASESDAGQRAVAQVVLNRLAHPTYPNSVCGVVFQGSERASGCQFSFTCDGSLARKPSLAFWQRASRIARQALAGAVYEPVGMATHYHTLAVHPHWAPSLDQITVIGAHQFYRWKGRNGTRGAFTARYAGSEPSAATASQSHLANVDIAVPGVPALTQPAPEAGNFAASQLPASQPTSAANNLPQGGGVRGEFARSGTWRSTRD